MESRVLQEFSSDDLEQLLLRDESIVARVRAHQMPIIAELDRRQIPHADGCRSMQEWAASRLDVTPETAAALVSTAKRLTDKPYLAAALMDGDVSFDRVVAAARGDGDEAFLEFDIAGMRRYLARRRPLTRRAESEMVLADYVAIQPTLDGDAGRFHGSLTGIRFTTVEKALSDRGDEYRMLPDGAVLSRTARNAHALVAMAQDSLDRNGGEAGGTGSSITVFVDTTTEEATAQVEYGPRVGPAALEAIMCAGSVQIIGLDRGRPVVATDASRAIPPAIRRFVALRDDGCCADGCTSRYRLQPHHVVPRHRGGSNDPDNLRTLCWFHHHVVVHTYGFTIDPSSPPRRTRFLRPANRRGPP